MGPRVTATMDLTGFNAPVLKEERGSTRTTPRVKVKSWCYTFSLLTYCSLAHTHTHKCCFFWSPNCNSGKTALKKYCMCGYTHIHTLGLPWDDETVWNCSFLELMILQSSSSEMMGPYGPDVHFETRFMSALSTLGKEHIIYHLLTGS